jgi:protein-disulfide isomerase
MKCETYSNGGRKISGMQLSVPVSHTDHIQGAEHAPLTLVEFGDFECPNCKQAAPAVKFLLNRFTGRLRFVWRNFPLEEVHPHAFGAALAAEAAGGQGRFWPMHEVLLAHQDHLKPPQLRRYAEEIEIDMARYDADTRQEVHLQRVREHMEDGRRSGVRSTPGFFLDGRFVDVSFGLQHLAEAIQRLAP